MAVVHAADLQDRFLSRTLDKEQKIGATVSREWRSVIRTFRNSGVDAQRAMVAVTFVVTTNMRLSDNEVIHFVLGQNNLWDAASYLNLF